MLQSFHNQGRYISFNRIKQQNIIRTAEEIQILQDFKNVQYKQILDLTLQNLFTLNSVEKQLDLELFEREKGIFLNYLDILKNILYFSAEELELFKSGNYKRE